MDKHTIETEEQAMLDESVTTENDGKDSDAVAEDAIDWAKEAADWKDKYLRGMAEFENFRRRSIQEKADWIKLATQKLALEVCDVLDNFERALLQVEDTRRDDTFVKGVTMIEQQLRGVLKKEGIRKIEALGTPFDPAWHDALAHIPSAYDEDIVAAVIQNGYTMHDKILRPARVAVSSGKIETPREIPIEGDDTDNKD